MIARFTPIGIALAIVGFVQACSGADEPSPEELKATAQAESVRLHCGEQAVAYNGPLNTTLDFTAMLNGLPRPVDVPCVIAALPRPVGISATTSVVSLQPGSGRRNPRILMQAGGGLITSITLIGETSARIETSEPEFGAPGFTIKGDLLFPREQPVQESDFYRDLIRPQGPTDCGACHSGEHVARQVNGFDAFSSRALKPARNQIVPIAEVQALADECTADDTTPRCGMLRALFRDPEAIEALEFAPEILTIFGGNK